MQLIHVFVSFASSVLTDRSIVLGVIETLNASNVLQHGYEIRVTMWEKQETATDFPTSITPQEAINRGLSMPREADLYLLVIRDRIGTPFVSWDGTKYAGSPVWEYKMAVKSREERGLPFIFIYRYAGEPNTDDTNQLNAIEVLIQEYSTSQINNKGLMVDFESDQQLAELVEKHIMNAINQYWQQLNLQREQIFISYSRKDWEQYVSPLVDKLRQANLNIWVDQHLLESGNDWLDEINDALKSCQRMILCVSPDALESRHVKLEYRYFFNHGKLLYPIICRSAELPAELEALQYYDYKDLERLITLLKQ